MCVYEGLENGSEAKRLRQKAGALAACSGTLAMGPALSLTHGHHLFAWTLIAMQSCLLCVSMGLLARSRRVGRGPRSDS